MSCLRRWLSTLPQQHRALRHRHESLDVLWLRVERAVHNRRPGDRATHPSTVSAAADAVRTVATEATFGALVRHDDDLLVRRGIARTEDVDHGRAADGTARVGFIVHLELRNVLLRAEAPVLGGPEIVAVEVHHRDVVALWITHRAKVLQNGRAVDVHATTQDASQRATGCLQDARECIPHGFHDGAAVQQAAVLRVLVGLNRVLPQVQVAATFVVAPAT